MISPFDDFVLQTSANQQRMAESIRDIGNRDNGLYRLRRKMLPQGTLGANAYTVSPHDSYIGWCGGTASKGGTIQFPGPGSTGMGWGRLVIIKDEAGSAASFPMLIEGTSSQSFDGIGSVALKVNYGAIGVVSNGTTWQVAFRDPPESFGSARFNNGVRIGGTSGLVVGGTTVSTAGSTGYFMGSVGIGVNPPTAPLDVVGDAIVSIDGRIGGGLYVGAVATDPDADDIHYDGNLKSMKNATSYDVYGFVPLTSPLTSTSWDGDAYSTTAKTLIDLSAVFSAPAGIKAALVFVQLRDSGSSGTNPLLILDPANGANTQFIASCARAEDDGWRYANGIVSCDANGDIYYQTVASGAGTLDIIIQIWGYWI